MVQGWDTTHNRCVLGVRNMYRVREVVVFWIPIYKLPMRLYRVPCTLSNSTWLRLCLFFTLILAEHLNLPAVLEAYVLEGGVGLPVCMYVPMYVAIPTRVCTTHIT